MVFVAAARDLCQDAIPATKSRSGRPLKTSKHTDDLLRQKLRKGTHLSASELKEIHLNHLGNISDRCIQHSLQKDLNIPSRRATSKALLTPHMKKKCLQFALRYLHRSVDDREKIMSSDESTFQCISNSEKGTFGCNN